jgi:Protein of unknown function (DUF3551)
MRAIDLGSVSLVLMMLLVTDANAASNRWCASIPKRSENCGYATLDQCRAYVLGLGGWCRPNPFPGTAFGTSGTWSSGPPRQYRGGFKSGRRIALARAGALLTKAASVDDVPRSDKPPDQLWAKRDFSSGGS